MSFNGITLWKRNGAKSTAGLLVLSAILFLLAAFFYAFTNGWLGGSSVDEEFHGKISVEVLDCTYDSYMNWDLLVTYENVENIDVTILHVYINNNEVMYYGVEDPDTSSKIITTDLEKGTSVLGGRAGVFNIWIGRDYGFLSSGSFVYVTVECLGGYSITATTRLI